MVSDALVFLKLCYEMWHTGFEMGGYGDYDVKCHILE